MDISRTPWDSTGIIRSSTTAGGRLTPIIRGIE